MIARAGKRPRVVLEATYGWYWAADTLAAAGAQVHLAHPLGVKAFSYRRVKNDEKDAADLADLLRMGRLPQGWIAPAEIRELRELTRYRIKLVRLRTSCKDQVHAVLAKLGIEVTCSDEGEESTTAAGAPPAPAIRRMDVQASARFMRRTLSLRSARRGLARQREPVRRGHLARVMVQDRSGMMAR